MVFTEGNPQLAEHRRFAAKLFDSFFPMHIHDDFKGLRNAGELVRRGQGLIIFFNHFSLRDGPAALAVASMIESSLDRRLLAPVARHISDGAGLINRMLGTKIDIMPIVTESTIGKPKFSGLSVGEGSKEYMIEAIEVLRSGGVVVVAPQRTRKPYLGEPERHDKAMAHLMTATTLANVEKIGILPVGFYINNIDDYLPHTGLNPGVLYEANIGSLWLKANAVLDARSHRITQDRWAFGQLSALLPPEYPRIPPTGDIYSSST